MSLLEMIQEPSDLRHIRPDLLPEVAQEIRQNIINVTAKTGGHLGASLGCTDIIVALHYVFNSPKDKLVFDTGHQAYAHKLLTGRAKNFHTLRQYKGVSGFPTRFESKHDAFGVGHASTSISAALGYAAARDIQREDFKVVALVNDGSITGGMAFEGLQNAGNLGTDLLVVLNDNQMFISHRVGAVGAFLAKFLTGGIYQRFEKRVGKFLTRMTFWGSHLLRLAKRVKVFLFPGMLFEEMGFSYLGPVDGHDLPKLIEVLEAVKALKGPIVLHCVTKKGRGYPKAESEPIKYHGVGQWDPKTGNLIKSTNQPPSYTQVFSKTICRLAEENEKVVAITAAMPEGTGLDAFRDKFKERYFDVGLGEQHAVTFAGGLACGGLKPVVAIYSSFLQRAFDQIEHDICLQKLPVVFCLDRAGLVGDDGPTHHGTFDLSFLRILPNIAVMAPKDENEFQHMLKTAVNFERGPVAIRYPRGAGIGVPMDSTLQLIPWGRGEVVRDGEEFAILAIGNTVHPSIIAAQKLEHLNGLKIRVINARFVKPLDKKWLLESLQGIKNILTVEENALAGGFGSAIREILGDTRLSIHSLGVPDRFVEHGPQEVLRDEIGISQAKIMDAVMKIHAGKFNAYPG